MMASSRTILMETTCIKDDPEDIPLVPPGFGSLASITLQRIQEDAKSSADELDSVHPVSIDEKSRKSLRHRTCVNYSQFDCSSGDESDYENIEQDMPLKQNLRNGVLRGCNECSNCQKVVAMWRPQDARRPVLDEAPSFYPTEEEFKDTLKYIASIRPIAEQYGICRIVPPPSWRPHCVLKDKDTWTSSKFSTRIQQIDKLQNRDSPVNTPDNHNSMRRKRPKLSKMGDNSDKTMIDISHQNNNYSERFGFVPGPDFTLESFQKYADEFKERYFRMAVNSDMMSMQRQPTIENIEGEYWRIVEKPTEQIEVLYGADLDTKTFGSGFPRASDSSTNSEVDSHYVSSGWNLNNFPKLPGSVLSFESGDISGVLIPWLYIGMCFSSFCWHVEDHHLYSLNYLHWGAPKMWYGVPEKDAPKLEGSMRKQLPHLFEEQPDLLHNLVTQCSPSLLKLDGVPVYRCVQNAGEFVLTFPRAYHSGFNCGFNCAEAVNVAPVDWLPHGHHAVELYREQARRISISHDKLLLGAAREAVKAQWTLQFRIQTTADNLRWKDHCGPDSILAKALKARLELELQQRESLCSSQTRKMDADFDSNIERECFFCHYDLHLSAASCICAPDKLACLIHAKQLCSCPWSSRQFLFRYEISELKTLVDALVGAKLSAVHKCAVSVLGLSLSSFVTKDKRESKTAGMTNREEREPKNNGLENQGGTRPDLPKQSDVSMMPQSSPAALKEGEMTKHNAVELKSTIHDNSSQQIKSVTFSVAAEPSVRVDRSCQSGGFQSSNASFGSISQQILTRSIMKPTPLSNNLTELKQDNNQLTPTCQMEKNMSAGEVKDNYFFDGGKALATKLVSNKIDHEPLTDQSFSFAKLTNCDDKVASRDAQRDQYPPRLQTNALSASGNDIDPLPVMKASCHHSNLESTSNEAQQSTSKKNNLDCPDQHTNGSLPRKMSGGVESGIVIALVASNFTVKGMGGYSSSHMQLPRMSGSGNLHDESKDSKESHSERNLIEKVNLVAPNPSCSENNSGRANRQQKGPRIAKVVRKINCSVEVLEYGVVLSDRLWSTSKAIFPKGYRSRVRYFSILDPTQMCYYTSRILDAGLLGPLFMVEVDQYPNEVFFHVSATSCWDLVRERVNLEIGKHHSRGRSNLPTLQLPGSIDGLDMFGLSLPAIIQKIEELDRNHVCLEYWRSKDKLHSSPISLNVTATDCSQNLNNDQSISDQSSLAAPSMVIRNLFKRANLEELHALQNLINTDGLNNPIQLAQLLDEEIKSDPR